MNALTQLYVNHPYISTLGTYYIVSAFVGALPSPTAGSSVLYQFFFKFANTLGGNLLRALSTRIESSPNFQDAVNAQLDKKGEQKMVITVPEKEEK